MYNLLFFFLRFIHPLLGTFLTEVARRNKQIITTFVFSPLPKARQLSPMVNQRTVVNNKRTPVQRTLSGQKSIHGEGGIVPNAPFHRGISFFRLLFIEREREDTRGTQQSNGLFLKNRAVPLQKPLEPTPPSRFVEKYERTKPSDCSKYSAPKKAASIFTVTAMPHMQLLKFLRNRRRNDKPPGCKIKQPFVHKASKRIFPLEATKRKYTDKIELITY